MLESVVDSSIRPLHIPRITPRCLRCRSRSMPRSARRCAISTARCSVLAGAGSGKTRVITAKIAHLLATRPRREAHRRDHVHQHVPRAKCASAPRSSCRREGKGDLAADVTICTFHALGLRIIRGDAAALGLKPGFSILDPGDIEPIVAELLQTTDRARARAAQWRISAWKNALRVAGGGGEGGAERRRRSGRHGLSPLRRDAARLSGGRLRRPDRVADRAPRRGRAPRRRNGASAAATCSSTNTRTPIRRSTGSSGFSSGARGVHRRRRRRPGDLRLARRLGRQPRRSCRRISRR